MDVHKSDWEKEFGQNETRGGMVLVTITLVGLLAFGLGWLLGSLT